MRMNRKKPALINRLKSFRYAFEGLIALFREEPNARIQILAAILAIAAGKILEISKTEWMAMFLAIGMVVAAEAFNSALENLSDFVSPEKKPQIKKAKDLAAAAVLISAITALIIGIVIFLPKILSRLDFFVPVLNAQY